MLKVGAVEIVGLGSVVVATKLWRSLGVLRATAIVKATFDFVPGGVMTIAESTRLAPAEAHHAGNPMRSIRAAGELSPFLKKADVIFVGQAYAPGGVAVPRSSARLAILRNGWALIDKTLTVIGDRTAPEIEPTPFLRMPVVYERALGGLGSAENPLGTGLDSTKGRILPNFVHPAEDRVDPAGFGPISWAWPARRRRLRGYPRKQLEEVIAELPDDFDPEFFQASPPDQRATYLRGDEHIVLEGLHPTHPRMETALPGVRGVARVYTPDGIEINLTLHADTLYIDGEAEQASIIWRGSFPVGSEEAIGRLRILAGVDSPGRPIAWPTPARLEADRPPAAPMAAPAPAAAPLPALDGTYVLSESMSAEAGALVAPFAIAAPGAAAPSTKAPIPGAPWAPQEASPRVVKESNFEGTQMITDEKATAILSASTLLGAVAPFNIAAAGAALGVSQAPIPGAPWAPAKAQRPPPPRPTASLDSTIAVDPEARADDEDVTLEAPPTAPRPRRPPPPAPPPPPAMTAPMEPIEPIEAIAPIQPIAAPVAPAAPAAPTNSWSWVDVAPAASTIEKPSAPRPDPPKPALSKKLYGAFGSKKT